LLGLLNSIHVAINDEMRRLHVDDRTTGFDIRKFANRRKPQKMLRNGPKVRCWASQRSVYETIVTGLATGLRLAGAVAFAQSSSLLLVLLMI